MTLPTIVEECLREREYSIGICKNPYFFMSISTKYEPGQGSKHLCTVTYQGIKRKAVFTNPNVLDKRLKGYIERRVQDIVPSKNLLEDHDTVYRAFFELQHASGRF